MPTKAYATREGEPADRHEVPKFDELFNEKEDAFNMDDRKKRVGGYILGRTLGEGSFAKVRLGTHIATQEKVAVKVINKRVVAKREYVRKNMRREAVMMQRLAHPNIVQLIEVMETENSFYMVTELAEGGDFMKYLTDRGPNIYTLLSVGTNIITRLLRNHISEQQTRKYMRQIVSAVDHMHRSGVLHRDLKIENLLLDADNNMKIIDFGLSNHWDGESLLATQCGSPAYAAPEIFGKQAYGPEVDVWSIGINMYAMLTGRLPFLVEPANNLQKLHALILRGARIPDYLSKDCQDLLSRLLEPTDTKRITIPELMHHPWINDGFMPLDPWGLKVKPHPEEINNEVVWFMVEYLNVTEDNVRDSVINFKPNATTGNYFILCQRLRRGLGLPNGAKYPNSQRMNTAQGVRRSMRNNKPVKEGTVSTIQATSEPKHALPKTGIHVQAASEPDPGHSNNDPDYVNHMQINHLQNDNMPNGNMQNGNVQNGGMQNGHGSSSNDGNSSEQTEVVYQNLPQNGLFSLISEQQAANGVYESPTPHLIPVSNVPQSNPQQYSLQPGYTQAVPSIQREKAASVLNSVPNTPREAPQPILNQQVFEIETMKRTSLPDIPVEVGLTPRAAFRDSMRITTKKKRPKKERGIHAPQDKSSSVPDHLNSIGAGYKQKPGHLADSISLRNATKHKYYSKPDDMNHAGRHGGSQHQLNNHMATQPYYMSQTLHQHNGMDPNTVLHGTHQLTPAEHAQLEALRARDMLHRQTSENQNYPVTPPSTGVTPRRYGYTVTSQKYGGGAGGNGRSHDVTNGIDDRRRPNNDFDHRNVGERASRRMNGAHSKENVNNTQVANAGFYTIAHNGHHHQHHGHQRTNSIGRAPAPRTDPTKYQSPFVRRDSKRLSNRSNKDVNVQELLTPRSRNPGALTPQVVASNQHR